MSEVLFTGISGFMLTDEERQCLYCGGSVIYHRRRYCCERNTGMGCHATYYVYRCDTCDREYTNHQLRAFFTEFKPWARERPMWINVADYRDGESPYPNPEVAPCATWEAWEAHWGEKKRF